MAWNDSGGNGNNKDNDPWNKGKKNQSPPDLDKLFQQFQQRLRGFLKDGNDKGNGGSKSNGKSGGSGGGISFVISLVLVGVLIIWGLGGFFIVRPAEQAVILRFGRYIEKVGPGLHWIPPLIDSTYKIDTIGVHDYIYKSDMLTKDESIIDVEISVQYRIQDPEAFLFNVANPITSLQEATASALRQVIGHNVMDDILTNGRALVKKQVKTQLIDILSVYRTGLSIVDVNLQTAKPPSQVRDAFDDAIRAQEDERRYQRQAEAYRKQIIPAAYGKARGILAEAQAYQKNVTLAAEGNTAGFVALLPEYRRAPKVMRERMYLSTIERVLKDNQLVFVDVNSSNNLLYLPIEKMLSEKTVTRQQINVMPSNDISKQTSKSTSTAASHSSGSPSGSYLSIADRDSYLGRFEQ